MPSIPERRLKQVVQLVGGHPGDPSQVEDHGGVDVPRARAHHQAGQRGQAHRGVEAHAAAHRAGRGAVAQVQHDGVESRSSRGPGTRRWSATRTGATCRVRRSDGSRTARRRHGRARRCRTRAACPGGTRCRTRPRAAPTGNVARAATMPATFAGLCSGASGDRSEIFVSTSSSITAGPENTAPPCTTRWPTAARCAGSISGPCSAKSAIMSAMPAVWSGISRSIVVVPSGPSCLALPISRPIRSTMPDASDSTWSRRSAGT